MRVVAVIAVCTMMMANIVEAGRGGGKNKEANRIQEHKNDFISFDVNQDNYVDAYEVRRKHPTIPHQEISALFISTDTNQDGLITVDEYIAASLEQDKKDGILQ